MSFEPQHSEAIVLNRIDYGDSDRIITFLTKDYGQIRVIAKAVRKEKSKLAGAIELFSVSQIGFVQGRGELATLTAGRLIRYYDNLLHHLDRVSFGYDCLKMANRATVSQADTDYFRLLERLFQSLNDTTIDIGIIAVWWYANLSYISGHCINVSCLSGGEKFDEGQRYVFDMTKGGFKLDNNGSFTPEHIKFLRLALKHIPAGLSKVKGGAKLAENLNSIMPDFIQYHH